MEYLGTGCQRVNIHQLGMKAPCTLIMHFYVLNSIPFINKKKNDFADPALKLRVFIQGRKMCLGSQSLPPLKETKDHSFHPRILEQPSRGREAFRTTPKSNPPVYSCFSRCSYIFMAEII